MILTYISFAEKNLPVPRQTLLAIGKRRETIQRRKSQMPQFNNIPAHFDNIGNGNDNLGATFDEPTNQESQL